METDTYSPRPTLTERCQQPAHKSVIVHRLNWNSPHNWVVPAERFWPNRQWHAWPLIHPICWFLSAIYEEFMRNDLIQQKIIAKTLTWRVSNELCVCMWDRGKKHRLIQMHTGLDTRVQIHFSGFTSNSAAGLVSFFVFVAISDGLNFTEKLFTFVNASLRQRAKVFLLWTKGKCENGNERVMSEFIWRKET